VNGFTSSTSVIVTEGAGTDRAIPLRSLKTITELAKSLKEFIRLIE